MRKFARPAFITLCAAAIVLAGALFAASRSSKSTEPSETVAYVSVNAATHKLAFPSRSAAQGASLRLAAPSAVAAHTAKGAGDVPQIARTGSVSLLVSSVDKAVSAVSAIARGQDGDVLSLDDRARSEQGGPPSADLELRVPDARFDAAMRALGGVGSARSRSISAEDLTTQIVDSSARLRNLRRTEIDIQKIMDRSGSIGQILVAENQLSSVREQIETLDADLKDMRNRVSYSTISVSLAARCRTCP